MAFEIDIYDFDEGVGTWPICVHIIVPVGKELGFDLTVPITSTDGPLAGTLNTLP